MDRSEVETAVRTACAHRAANDGVSAAEIFARDAVYRVAGDPAYCAFASTVSGHTLIPRLEMTCAVFHAKSFELETLLIDADRDTAIVQADFVFAPNREVGRFELCHLWTFRVGKAVGWSSMPILHIWRTCTHGVGQVRFFNPATKVSNFYAIIFYSWWQQKGAAMRQKIKETLEENEGGEPFYEPERYEKPKNVFKGMVVYPITWHGRIYPAARRKSG